MTVPVVPVELARERSVIARPAVFAPARVVVALFVASNRKCVVSRYKKIQKAVAVVIEERRARAEGIVAHAGRGGYIGERSISVVVIQNVPAVVSHKKVWVAVIVVITHRHAHSESALAGHAGLLRHVG